jgi:hypothetical protein
MKGMKSMKVMKALFFEDQKISGFSSWPSCPFMAFMCAFYNAPLEARSS